MPHGDRKLRRLIVGYLWSQGCKNKEIAELLSIGEATVSRDLERAKRNGEVRETRSLAREHLVEDELDEVEQSAYGALIRRPLLEFARRELLPLDEVRVFYSGMHPGGEETWNTRLARFARAAAPTVLDLLARSTFCGVTWGTTLAAIVDAVTRLELPSEVEHPVVFPTAGEPLGSTERPQSSSYIARHLAEILDPESSSASPSLTGIAAVVPLKFLELHEFPAIRHFIEDAKPYQQIFGHQGAKKGAALIDRMDCLLTSLGRPERLVSMYEAELIESAGFDRDQLRGLVYADVGGVLIPRVSAKPLSARDRKTLDDFERLWTGLRAEHLIGCNERAPAGAPGVVLMALSRQKADAVIRCVENGWVRTLIVDHHLGQAIAEKLSIRPE